MFSHNVRKKDHNTGDSELKGPGICIQNMSTKCKSYMQVVVSLCLVPNAFNERYNLHANSEQQ